MRYGTFKIGQDKYNNKVSPRAKEMHRDLKLRMGGLENGQVMRSFCCAT